jgi:O-antigen/teichoic acid export membrane protein
MGLREKVLRGGLYLVLRQAAGTILGVLSVFLVTRAIGPGAYGVYAAAQGVGQFVLQLAQLGVGMYLIRAKEVREDDLHQGFTAMALMGAVIILLSYPLGTLVHHFTGIEGVELATLLVLVFGAVQLVACVPLATLERKFEYRRIALVELSGQAVFLVTAVPLAWHGMGWLAPLAGWVAQQGLTSILYYIFSGYRPRLKWDRRILSPMLSYGVGYSVSIWIWQLRWLVNPLVVGRLAGAEAVGRVALAIRIVESLSFLKGIGWRLSIPALAHIQNRRESLIAAVEEGMVLQVVASGSTFLAFSFAAPWIVGTLLGGEWDGVVSIYPLLAVATLANSLFALHSSALYVIEKNMEVSRFHAVHLAILGAGAWLLVGEFGEIGYGWAEMAAMGSYIVIHLSLARWIGCPDYRRAFVAAGAFGAAFLWPYVGVLSMCPLALSMAFPGTWRILLGYARLLFGKT